MLAPHLATYTDAEVVAMLALEHPEETDDCTEWSCMYHGERNEVRKRLAVLRERGDARARSGGGR